MQKCVTLSVTEAEVMAAVECAQDMLFVANLLESLGLKVKKPMILECDNKGATELAHGWQVNGRTRHVANKIYYLRELKENGEILMKCVKTEDNSADILTKNLGGAAFEKHCKCCCGDDQVEEVVEVKDGKKEEENRNSAG